MPATTSPAAAVHPDPASNTPVAPAILIEPAAAPCAFISSAPTATKQLTRLPLIPTGILRQHRCFVSTDTRFRAAARLLQSLWRADQQLPMSLHVSANEQPTSVKLGSRLTAAAGHAGRNFVSPEVYALVRRELILREEGACIDEDRLNTNLLSSMPLAFNLLGPLALDLDLASRVLAQLLPTFIHSVQGISFEHSPGRGDPKYLSDGTAFDAVVAVTTPDGEPATIFVEVKYSEAMTGPAATRRPRYDEASRQVRLFQDPDSPELRTVALEQLWREHMLGQLAVDHGAANKAVFVAIAPRLNRRAMAAFQLYTSQLADPEPEDELRVPFVGLTLETFIEALAAAGATDLATQLRQRYLDFQRVLELALTPPAKPLSSPRRRARPAKRVVTQPQPPQASSPQRRPQERHASLRQQRGRPTVSPTNSRPQPSSSAR